MTKLVLSDIFSFSMYMKTFHAWRHLSSKLQGCRADILAARWYSVIHSTKWNKSDLSKIIYDLTFFQESYYQGTRSLAHIYKIVFPTILKLAADEDRVIKDLVSFVFWALVIFILQIFLFKAHLHWQSFVH
jgi:hypothetical protein